MILVEHPTNRGATGINALNAKPMIRRVNTSITTMTQWLRRSIDSQAKQIDAPQAVFICPIKLKPRTDIGSRFGSIVFRQHPADNVFVDIDAESVRKLLCDAGTANTGVAAFELDDRVDEFPSTVLRAGAADDLPTRKATDICVS